ncbi:MAG: hypothetical protein WCX82_04920 [archaeon]|jgi:hypothetical protein
MMQEIPTTRDRYKNKEDLRFDFHSKVFSKLVWKLPLTKEEREIFKLWIDSFNPSMHFFEHYKDKRVLYEIVKYLKNNEFCLNSNIRWLYSSKIEYLLKIIYFYRVLEYKGENKKGETVEGLTFYCGLANFSSRSPPPFNPKEKKEWQENYWTRKVNPEYIKKITGYNFGLDIDGKDFNEAYHDAKEVIKFFNKFKIRFSVWCSGKKGFHIIIPYEEFREQIEPFDLDYAIVFCKSLMLDLVKYLKLKKVDTLIYSASRFLKVPYSLDMRNGRVIYPLSDNEFLSFNENMMSRQYLLSQKDLGNRGVYINRPSNIKGFEEMINFLEEKIK